MLTLKKERGLKARSAFRMSLLAVAMVFGAASPALAGEAWRVGTWKTAQTIAPFFYREFAPAGVEVEVFSFSNPADQKTALLAGSLDFCGTTLAHAIASASRGEPVVVVAALCNRCSALVVKKDGPVRRVADLAGRKIGYVPGTMHEILLRETLVKNGLSPERDVSLVRVDFFDMGTALASGGIDAFLSGEPFPTLARVQGTGRILAYPYYDDSVGTLNAAMLVTRTFLAAHPDRVAAMVLAHARATRHLKSNPGPWLDAAAKFGTDRRVLSAASENMELAWDMDEAFVARVKALGTRMKALGLIETEPDYAALVDLAFVRQASKARNER